jgi:hypothetical protein
MGSFRSGQMFIVTSVFMVGIFFIILQSLLQYSSVDISEPVRANEYALFKTIPEAANATIQESLYCDKTKGNLQNNLKEFKTFVEGSYSPGILAASFDYQLSCNRWFPDPVSVTVSIAGFGRQIEGRYEFKKGSSSSVTFTRV